MQLCNREGWKEEADQMSMKDVKRGMYTVVRKCRRVEMKQN